MELIVRNGERERELVVTETDAGYEVRIDDRSYRVEIARVGSVGRSLVIDGRQYEVGVRASGRGRFEVDTEESTLALEVMDPLSRLAEAAHGSGAQSGAGLVTAYMPGRVVTVLLAEGDEVELGQGVVVLEAMKMENEIQADRSGIIKKIHVDAGQAVDGGSALFEIGARDD